MYNVIMFNVEIIGYIAGVLIAITMVPQLYISIKTKSVVGVSLVMLVIFFISMVCWFVYGLLIENYPIIIFNGLATFVSGIQLFIKFKYSKNNIIIHIKNAKNKFMALKIRLSINYLVVKTIPRPKTFDVKGFSPNSKKL